MPFFWHLGSWCVSGREWRGGGMSPFTVLQLEILCIETTPVSDLSIYLYSSICRWRVWSGCPRRWSNRGPRLLPHSAPTTCCWRHLEKRYTTLSPGSLQRFGSERWRLVGAMRRLDDPAGSSVWAYWRLNLSPPLCTYFEPYEKI